MGGPVYTVSITPNFRPFVQKMGWGNSRVFGWLPTKGTKVGAVLLKEMVCGCSTALAVSGLAWQLLDGHVRGERAKALSNHLHSGESSGPCVDVFRAIVQNFVEET